MSAVFADCAPEALEQDVRHVLVTVNALGQASCVPELLDVSGEDVLITFHLNAADWVFPETEAVVVQNGGTQFPIPSWTVHKKQAALLDCDSAPGDFSYTVNLQHVPTGRRASVDPTIRNNP